MAQTLILMLQADAFCEHTTAEYATAAGAPPQTLLWGSLQRYPPDPLASFKGAEGGVMEREKS